MQAYVIVVSLLSVSPVTPSVAGQIVALNGSATMDRKPQTAQPLKPGDMVREGDTVHTAAQSSMRILLQDNSVIDLGPETVLTVQTFTTRPMQKPLVRLQAFLGRLWAHVMPREADHNFFSVEGPAAVAGVRGTSFFMDVTGGKTTITTVTGGVDVQDHFGHNARLGPLQRTSTQGDKLVNSQVTAVELTQLQHELTPPSRLDNNTVQARLQFATQQGTPGAGHPLTNGRDVLGNGPGLNTTGSQQPLNIDPATRLTHVQGKVTFNP